MKVVHVFKDFYPPLIAGITRYIRDVADESARRGAEVDVHVAGVRTSRRDVLPSGVVVHRHRELGRLLSSPLAPGLMREPAGQEGILHLHMPNPLGEVGPLLIRRRKGIVVTFHAQLGRQRLLEPVYGPVRRSVLGRSHAILVSSERMALVPELAKYQSKTRVLPFGVSPLLVGDGSGATDAGDGTLRLLFVGRLVYYKGLDVLLQAIERLPRSSLTVIGDGPLRGELEELAAKSGLSERVRFLGSVDDSALRDAYQQHDVFILPSVSRAEAFGLAMSEAMANGMPVVSTSLGTGTDWVNRDGESGLVVPPGDVSALVTAISDLAAPELRHRLGKGAKARAAALFSFERHVDELHTVYEKAADAD